MSHSCKSNYLRYQNGSDRADINNTVISPKKTTVSISKLYEIRRSYRPVRFSKTRRNQHIQEA